jgi:hypothetical protein
MAFREMLTVECENQMKRINGPHLGGQIVMGRGRYSNQCYLTLILLTWRIW